jgi:hypothetical protein
VQLALLGGLGEKSGEYGLNLAGGFAGGAFDISLFPLLEGEDYGEVLLAFHAMKIVSRHENTSPSCLFGISHL